MNGALTQARPRSAELQERPKFKVCGICQVKTAQKTVLRSRLAPTSPCFFCAECFQVRGHRAPSATPHAVTAHACKNTCAARR